MSYRPLTEAEMQEAIRQINEGVEMARAAGVICGYPVNIEFVNPDGTAEHRINDLGGKPRTTS